MSGCEAPVSERVAGGGAVLEVPDVSLEVARYAASIEGAVVQKAKDEALRHVADVRQYDWSLGKIRHRSWIAQWYGDGTEKPFEPLFFGDGELTPAGVALVSALKNAGDHALDPAVYDIEAIEGLVERIGKMRKTLTRSPRLELTREEIAALATWYEAHKGDTAEARLAALCDSSATPLPRVAAFYEAESSRVEEYLALARGIETKLADSWFSYSEDMKMGNLMKYSSEELAKYTTEDNPNEVHPKHFDSIISERVTAATRDLVANSTSPQVVFDGLVPAHEQYAKLQTVRGRYRAIVDGGGWATVAPDRMFAGGRAPLVRALKQRLAVEGYDAGDVQDDLFDEKLTSAIRAYQKYHQLDETGEVNDVFWRSLNVAAQQRLAEIEANIRHWHRSIFEPRAAYIYINLPSFTVEVWRNGERIAEHRTVVGNSTKVCNTRTMQWEMINATKIMHARMTYLVFNPYWNVPPRIEVDEYQKKMAEDPKWLAQSDFEYFTPRGGGRVLRQKPGEHNALGRVKLIFPNRYNIYLHDTPKQQMFTYAIRAFSHGCIRVENAMGFAQSILEIDGQWDAARIDKFFKEAGEHPVDLKTPLDVFIDYHTVTVDEHGQPYFLADIYRYIRDEIAPPSPAQLRCDPSIDKTSAFRSGEQLDSGP